MNEKFKKDQVWGELGGKEGGGGVDQGKVEPEGDEQAQLGAVDKKGQPKYSKVDFFDTISCDALERERETAERRTQYQQRRIDTEVNSLAFAFDSGAHLSSPFLLLPPFSLCIQKAQFFYTFFLNLIPHVFPQLAYFLCLFSP